MKRFLVLLFLVPAGLFASYGYPDNTRYIPVYLSATPGDEMEINVKITIPWESGMQTDFGDLRFYGSDGEAEYNAWMENLSYEAGDSSVWWVKIPTKHAAGETFYVCFGDADAATISDGESTFPYFNYNLNHGPYKFYITPTPWIDKIGSYEIGYGFSVAIGDSSGSYHPAMLDPLNPGQYTPDMGTIVPLSSKYVLMSIAWGGANSYAAYLGGEGLFYSRFCCGGDSCSLMEQFIMYPLIIGMTPDTLRYTTIGIDKQDSSTWLYRSSGNSPGFQEVEVFAEGGFYAGCEGESDLDTLSVLITGTYDIPSFPSYGWALIEPPVLFIADFHVHKLSKSEITQGVATQIPAWRHYVNEVRPANVGQVNGVPKTKLQIVSGVR